MRAGGQTERPGALVIGGDYQGLAIARSLGRDRVPVVVIDDELSISRYSRYVSRAIRVGDLRDEEATVSTLAAAGRRYGLEGWVVFPTREETVAALARHRSVLAQQYRIPTPGWEVIKWAWDKRNTYRLAAELGVPTPRTWTFRSAEELSSVDGEPPFVIKPAIKEHFFYATGRKAWRADSFDELSVAFRQASELIGGEEVIVQEMIPGSGEAQLGYCAFFKDGQPQARMVVRRLRQHPPDFGRASTYVRTVEAPELHEPAERFLRAIDYYGLVELEFKHDVRDGVTKLLDVNARTWGYHSLGQRAGVDFPLRLYRDQIGAPLPGGVEAEPGVGWVRLATDLPTAALELAQGRMTWRPYVRSLLAADTEAVFSREDPLPGLAELALLPYAAVKRGL